MTDRHPWEAATWEGARREQLRRALRLSVRERLKALDALARTNERLRLAAGRPSADAASVREPGNDS